MKLKFKNALFVIFSILLLKNSLESNVIPKLTNELTDSVEALFSL